MEYDPKLRKQYANQVEISELIGLSKSSVSRHLANGKVPKRYSKKIKCEDGKVRVLWKKPEAIDILKAAIDPTKSRKPDPVPVYDPDDSENIEITPADLTPEVIAERIKEIEDQGLDSSMPLAEAQRLKAVYQVAILNHDLAVKRGEVLDKENTLSQAAEYATVFKSRLMDLCDRTAPILAGMEDPQDIAMYLRKEGKVCLQAIADWGMK